MYSLSVFIAVAVSLASLHMIAPDHWLPLTALSIKRKYGKGRVFLFSISLGFLHGLTSVALSILALFLGVKLFGPEALKEISILILAAVAVYMLAVALREGNGSRKIENTSLIVSVLPDPVLLPIVVASYALSLQALAIVSVAFVLATILSLGAVMGAIMAGIGRSLYRLKPTEIDFIVIGALVVTAVYIYLFG